MNFSCKFRICCYLKISQKNNNIQSADALWRWRRVIWNTIRFFCVVNSCVVNADTRVRFSEEQKSCRWVIVMVTYTRDTPEKTKKNEWGIIKKNGSRHDVMMGRCAMRGWDLPSSNTVNVRQCSMICEEKYRDCFHSFALYLYRNFLSTPVSLIQSRVISSNFYRILLTNEWSRAQNKYQRRYFIIFWWYYKNNGRNCP